MESSRELGVNGSQFIVRRGSGAPMRVKESLLRVERCYLILVGVGTIRWNPVVSQEERIEHRGPLG